MPGKQHPVNVRCFFIVICDSEDSLPYCVEAEQWAICGFVMK